jgi:hypothetical protein
MKGKKNDISFLYQKKKNYTSFLVTCDSLFGPKIKLYNHESYPQN